MLAAIGILLGLLLRRTLGGRLRDIGGIRMRGEKAFVAVLLLVLCTPILSKLSSRSPDVVFAVWLVLMFVLLGLCLANLTISGFPLISAGVACNAAVIATNRGMPVSVAAVFAVGGQNGLAALAAGDVFHAAVNTATRIPLLSDTLPFSALGLAPSVFSIGDVLMAIGIATVLLAQPPSPVVSATEHARTGI